jgi:hypothetical protein
MRECDFTDQDIIDNLTYARPTPTDARTLVTVEVEKELSDFLYGLSSRLFFEPLHTYNTAVAEMRTQRIAHQFSDRFRHKFFQTTATGVSVAKSCERADLFSPRKYKSHRLELAELKQLISLNKKK